MNLSEIVPREIKGKKYSYEIKLVSKMPPKVSALYNGSPLLSIGYDEKSLLCNLDDDDLYEFVSSSVFLLESDIKQGFLDKRIDKYKNVN